MERASPKDGQTDSTWQILPASPTQSRPYVHIKANSSINYNHACWSIARARSAFIPVFFSLFLPLRSSLLWRWNKRTMHHQEVCNLQGQKRPVGVVEEDQLSLCCCSGNNRLSLLAGQRYKLNVYQLASRPASRSPFFLVPFPWILLSDYGEVAWILTFCCAT